MAEEHYQTLCGDVSRDSFDRAWLFGLDYDCDVYKRHFWWIRGMHISRLDNPCNNDFTACH